MLLAWLRSRNITSMLTACGSPVFDRSLKLIDLGLFFFVYKVSENYGKMSISVFRSTR